MKQDLRELKSMGVPMAWTLKEQIAHPDLDWSVPPGFRWVRTQTSSVPHAHVMCGIACVCQHNLHIDAAKCDDEARPINEGSHF